MSDNVKINLAETFVSIQGEGYYLGTPSFFVRTSGCNLRCQWNGTRCDTPYTSWQARHQAVTVREVVERIADYQRQYPIVDHLVLTGGEPLLQGHLIPLVDALKELGLFITLETNGTIFKELAIDFVSLSPKLASSTPEDPQWHQQHAETRIQLVCLEQWIRHYPFQLKFVVNAPADEAEIAALLDDFSVSVSPDNVYLMPQGIDAEQLAEHARICVDICVRRGWRYTPRAHIDIYGNAAGT